MTLTEREYSVAEQSGLELFESVGLEEADIRGKRVIILTSQPNIRAAIEKAGVRAEISLVDVSLGTSEVTILDAEDESTDLIIDLRSLNQPSEANYSAENYQELMRVLHHRGKLLIPDPINKRAIPITEDFNKRYRTFCLDSRVAETTKKLSPVIGEIFEQRKEATDDVDDEDGWWQIISEMVREQISIHGIEADTILGELVLILSHRLEREFDYQATVQIKFGRRPICGSEKIDFDKDNEDKDNHPDWYIIPDSKELTLVVEKNDYEVTTTYKAAKFFANDLEIELNYLELRELRKIVREILNNQKMRVEDAIKNQNNIKGINGGGIVSEPYAEAVVSFISRMYKIEITNQKINVNAPYEKTLLDNTMIIVNKYLKIKNQPRSTAKRSKVDVEVFDILHFPNYRAMSQAATKYRGRIYDLREEITEFAHENGVGIDEVEVECEIERRVSDELKQIVKRARASVIG